MYSNHSIAIIKYSTASAGTSHLIFDSYSRNSRGITDSPFAFSVLLLFVGILEKGIFRILTILLIDLIHHISRLIVY